MLSFTSSLSPDSEAFAIFVTEKYDYKDKRNILSNNLVQKINIILENKCETFRLRLLFILIMNHGWEERVLGRNNCNNNSWSCTCHSDVAFFWWMWLYNSKIQRGENLRKGVLTTLLIIHTIAEGGIRSHFLNQKKSSHCFRRFDIVTLWEGGFLFLEDYASTGFRGSNLFFLLIVW
mgnify:CR=1 FL=1